MPQMTLLSVEPSDVLRFTKVPEQPDKNHEKLTLKNNTSAYVAFKVKTTSPKSYLVRPSTAALGPNESAAVNIILQPGNDYGTSQHRFLVQAVEIPSREHFARDLWADIPKDQIQEKRLDVVHEQGAEAGKSRELEGGIPDDPADLKAKYDDILQKEAQLKEDNQKMKNERVKLQEEIRELKMKGGNGGGFTSVHIIIVAVVVFALSFGVQFVTR